MPVLIYNDETEAQDALDKILTFVLISKDLPEPETWPEMETFDNKYYVLAPDRNFDYTALNPSSTQSEMPSQIQENTLEQTINTAASIGAQLIDNFLKDAYLAGVNDVPGFAGSITRVLNQPIQDCQIGALQAAIDNLGLIIAEDDTGREGLPFTSNANLTNLRNTIIGIVSSNNG